ncbi:MAG TPA: hypothetical protein VF193_05005 [Steroidobacter sp.]
MNRLLVCLSITSFGLLTACGSTEEPSPPPAATNPAPAAAPAPAPEPAQPEDPTAKMAKAVIASGKPGAAVDIRYDFKAKPAIGTPVELEIAFVPSAPAETLEATLRGMEGLSLTGPLTATFNNVQRGEAYMHTITVLPQTSGVFYVSASVSMKTGDTSMGRTFAIPLVVGEVPAQKKAEPMRDASGEAIEPMQAEEPN